MVRASTCYQWYLGSAERFGEQYLSFVTFLPPQASVQNVMKQVFHGFPIPDETPRHWIDGGLLKHSAVHHVPILQNSFHLRREYLQ